MTRPSPPASVPWRSPRPAGMSSCRRWRTSYLGLAYQAQGDYRRAIDCLRQTVASLDGARHRERFGEVSLPAVLSRAALATCHAELGMFAEGRALGEEGLQIAEAAVHPASLMWAYWGLGLLSLRQGDLCQGTPPSSNGPWASVRTRTSRLGSPGWLQPWARRIPWAGASLTLCRCSRRRLEQSTAMERAALRGAL